ncbi:MAG: hypothetical protein M3Z31_01225 [Pseudomonadota bacterium]|nr:hypothetical protein [Pseudomonadota bacterium]
MDPRDACFESVDPDGAALCDDIRDALVQARLLYVFTAIERSTNSAAGPTNHVVCMTASDV